MIKVKIDNIKYNIQIAPVYTEALNETFDSLTFSLPFIPIEQPFKPQTSVLLIDDTSNKEIIIGRFVITKDEVEVVSHRSSTLVLGNDLYSYQPYFKHTISCTESIQNFNKTIIKDMKFSQPSKPIKNDYQGYCAIFNSDEGFRFITEEQGVNSQPCEIALATHEKVKSLKVKADIYKIKQMAGNCANFTKKDEMVQAETDSCLKGGSLWITIESGTYKQKVSIADDDEEIKIDSSIVNQLQKGETLKVYITPLSDLTTAEKYAGAYNVYPTTGMNTKYPFIQVNLWVEVQTYYYTLYDVLYDIRTASFNSYEFNKIPSEYDNRFPNGVYLPTGDLKTLLESIIAPEIIIQQMTLYQAIDEIAKCLDGLWKINKDTNTLEIEFLNKTNNIISNTDNKIANEKIILNDDRYANNLYCYYSGARPSDENLVVMPDENSFMFPIGQDTGAFADSNMVLDLQNPIQDIVKVEIVFQSLERRYVLGTSSFGVNFSEYVLDITKYVVSDEESSFVTYTDDTSKSYLYPTSVSTMLYSQGSNTIKIVDKQTNPWGYSTLSIDFAVISAIRKKWGFCESNLYETDFRYYRYQAGDDRPYNAKIRVWFKTSIDGKLRINSKENKYDGDMLVNQNASVPSLSSLGNNMFGLGLKVGQPERTITEQFKTFALRTKKGDTRTINGETWRADIVNTTIYNDFVECQTTYVKNFNQLSRRIEIDSQKRFYETQKTIKSENIINEYMAFSIDTTNTAPTKQKKYLGFTATEDGTCCLTKHFRDAFALNFTTKSTTGGEITEETIRADYAFLFSYDWLAMPMVSFGTANTLIYRCAYNHPINAGYRVLSDPWRNVVCSYTDENGFVGGCTLEIGMFKKNAGYSSHWYPLLGSAYNDREKSYFIYIPNIAANKKPNEILGITYQLSFVPVPKDLNNIFFGERLSVGNCLLTGKLKNLCVWYGNEKYTMSDKKGKGTKVLSKNTNIKYSSPSGNSSIVIVRWYDIASTNQHYAWAICDEFDNIIIAINDSGTEFCFYPTGADRPLDN